jgi:hypothetical protein
MMAQEELASFEILSSRFCRQKPETFDSVESTCERLLETQ